MKDHQTETIEQLRVMLKEANSKLEYRTVLLAQVIPHLQDWSNDYASGSSSSYISFEIMEKYGALIERFKDEYGKENQLQQNKDSKL